MSGKLDNVLDDFEVFEVSEFCNKNRVENPMDDELVPVIHSEKISTLWSEDFLAQNIIKKAIVAANLVDPMKLATSMGLSVKFVYITKEKSILVEVISLIAMRNYMIRKPILFM